MSRNWQLFHFPSPVSFYAWHDEADYADKLLSEWGWRIERRELLESEALARFLAFSPEPGDDQCLEQTMVSHWNGWHLLVDYGPFGGLREIYSSFPVPIIEFTVPAGLDLTQLSDAPDFRLDLMLGGRFYYNYVRDCALWCDELEPELSRSRDGRLVLQGNAEWAVEWHLGMGDYQGYGFHDRITLSSNLGQNLEILGVPIRRWQESNADIVNEVLKIVRQSDNKG